MYTLLWLSSACFLLLFFFLPETSSSNILFRRAARLRQAQQSGLVAKESKLISQAELDAEAMQTSDIVNMCLVHPFTLNFTEPMVFFLNLYTALIYGNNPWPSRPSYLLTALITFRASLYLVRVFSSRVLRHIPLQPRFARSVLPGSLRWNHHRGSTLLHLDQQVSRASI